MRYRTVHLCGPTASGKSAIAEALAERFDADIISVDSAQIYRGMDIGSAKPDLQTRARIAHHLIDILQPEQSYSAAQFCADARRALADIHERGKLAILVGGTMLYFRTLLRGLSALPESAPEVRAKLQAELSQHGLAALHMRLQQVDAAAAARIHSNDTQRILRALEVFEMTGEPLSVLQNTAASHASAAPDNCLHLGLMPADRALLHARIADRFDLMLQQGLIAEVTQLRTRALLRAEHPSMRSVGYRQVWQYLDGMSTHADMREQAIAATRQLAKRQITWLRSDPWLSLLDPESSGITDHISRQLEGL
jgi:tRNA dimethylallyltransferase